MVFSPWVHSGGDLEVCVELGLRPESGGARNSAGMKVKA